MAVGQGNPLRSVHQNSQGRARITSAPHRAQALRRQAPVAGKTGVGQTEGCRRGGGGEPSVEVRRCGKGDKLARLSAQRGRRWDVTWEFVTILMLVAFILGLFVGAGLVRPRG